MHNVLLCATNTTYCSLIVDAAKMLVQAFISSHCHIDYTVLHSITELQSSPTAAVCIECTCKAGHSYRSMQTYHTHSMRILHCITCILHWRFLNVSYVKTARTTRKTKAKWKDKTAW